MTPQEKAEQILVKNRQYLNPNGIHPISFGGGDKKMIIDVKATKDISLEMVDKIRRGLTLGLKIVRECDRFSHIESDAWNIGRYWQDVHKAIVEIRELNPAINMTEEEAKERFELQRLKEKYEKK